MLYAFFECAELSVLNQCRCHIGVEKLNLSDTAGENTELVTETAGPIKNNENRMRLNQNV